MNTGLPKSTAMVVDYGRLAISICYTIHLKSRGDCHCVAAKWQIWWTGCDGNKKFL